MVNLTKQEVLNLERVGSGNFGTVYRRGLRSYKLYHEKVKTDYHNLINNPSLRYKPFRLNRLMSLNQKLLYTDLVQDTLFIDGKFNGVVLPYYEGVCLSSLMNESLDKKIPIAYQMVRNSKELTRHGIYPMDYKLNNMILGSEGVRFIDLDDCCTKVSLFFNPIYSRRCVRGLDETIKTYFNEFRGCPFRRGVLKGLNREILSLGSRYEDIESYILEKTTPRNYIFMNDNVSIEGNIALLRSPSYSVIYVYDDGYANQGYVSDRINEFLGLGINLYDITPFKYNGDYRDDFIFDECLEIKGDKVLKIGSRRGKNGIRKESPS